MADSATIVEAGSEPAPDRPSRVILALSPGALSAVPIGAACALAEAFEVELHVVRLGRERAEQIARLPFTRELSATVLEFRRFEPADARLSMLGQHRRIEMLIARVSKSGVGPLVHLDDSPMPVDPRAWTLRDSAPWSTPFAGRPAYAQIVALVGDDDLALRVAALLPRARRTAVRALAVPGRQVRSIAHHRRAAAMVLGSLATRVDWSGATGGGHCADPGERQGRPGEPAMGGIIDEMSRMNTLIVSRARDLAALGLSDSKLAARVGIAVLTLS
ncbi:MAG: hypothetical protein R3E87_15245 [Burkholderiaceae bacterium]